MLRGGGAEGAEGWVVLRGSELVEYRIRSEHFRLAGSMFVSSLPRVCVCNSGVRVAGEAGSIGQIIKGASAERRACEMLRDGTQRVPVPTP